jgi:hypothetical protein
MRLTFVAAAAALALTACGNNDQSDNSMNVDENLTAENIVSNDVTAIDAVTGDAANMAADVNLNYGDLDENAAAASSNGSAPPAKPAPRKPAPSPGDTLANSSANSAINAE